MKKKYYALTLLEVMVVISLITLILGVLGYNMKNVLNKGKIFRTEQAMERLHNVFDLEIARGKTPEQVLADRKNIVDESGFGKKADDLLKDAWNEDFTFSLINRNQDIKSTSKTLENLKKEKR